MVAEPLRQYNEEDEALGYEGELIVYETLKKIYGHKYTGGITELETGFNISSSVKVIWHNKSGESKMDHDLKIIEGELEIIIDSKATLNDDELGKIPSYLSKYEYNLMASSQIYQIARVTLSSSGPEVTFIQMIITDLKEMSGEK